MFTTEGAGVFAGFGPSAFYSIQRPLTAWDLPRDGKGRRRLIRQCAPCVPGVYGMLDADGELIYVGKSKSLANRLMSYFPAKSSGQKSERIGRRAKRLVWETSPHEFLALLRELELIRRFSPRFNVEGRPEHQRPAFIYLTSGLAPYFGVAGQPPKGCALSFGPLRGVGRYRAAVEQLNRRFLLRDCSQKTPMIFADARELFPTERKPACLRYELSTCLAPCAAYCTSREYGASVQRAINFLRGDDRSVLDGLERAMREAARTQQFERAAALRDAWRTLMIIHRGMDRIRELRRNFSFVYELRCRRSQRVWVFLRGGHALGAHILPSGARTARAVSQRLANIYGAPDVGHDGEDLDMLRVVGSWFQRREEEIKATLTVDEAAAYCQKILRAAENKNPARGKPIAKSSALSGRTVALTGGVAAPP